MDGKLLFKLMRIQQKLKAPKSLHNSFTDFNYRNIEDILETVKPLCREENTLPLLSDDVVSIDGRWYVKATAILYDCETGHDISVTAYAREVESKKGNDPSQITGACSSYARKYAICGLFAIGSGKDADSEDNREPEETDKKQSKQKSTQELAGGPTTPDERKKLIALFTAKKPDGSDVFTKDEVRAFQNSRTEKTATILIQELEDEVKARTSFRDEDVPF